MSWRRNASLPIAAVVAVASFGPFIFAHDVITTKLTYSREVSRIFATRCLACHGATASIPLTTYEEVRPWAVDIKQQVLGRQMPPWGAVKGFGDLSPDDGLTQEEVLIIAAWVIGGAPQGDPALLPHDKAKAGAAPAAAAPLSSGAAVDTRTTLEHPLSLCGIKPLVKTDVASSRIVAHLPDGETLPLLWLFQYNGKWDRTFHFARPLRLPRGTVIEASSPVHFALETQSP